MATPNLDAEIQRRLTQGEQRWVDIVASIPQAGVEQVHARIRALEEQGLVEVDWRNRIVRSAMKAPEEAL